MNILNEFSELTFIWAGNPLKLMMFDAPTLGKYSQTNPKTFSMYVCFLFFSQYTFDVVTPVIPSFGQFILVRFCQL